MCYTCLKEVTNGDISDETGKTKSSKTAQGQLKTDATFQKLMTEAERMQSRPGGFGPHPKMETLKMLLIQHFGLRMDGVEGASDGQDVEWRQETRAMVFVTNRGCVDELVEWLNADRPLLRATRFIGQGTDKQGKKGFAQKEQLDVGFPHFHYSIRADGYTIDRLSKSLRRVISTYLFLRPLARRASTLVRLI